MRRIVLVFALLLAVTLLLMWRRSGGDAEPEHRPRDIARVEPSPICPWRNPERDLFQLFPPATNHVLEARIITGWTAPIQKQLGRSMHPDENPLRIHRVMHQGQVVGSVLVTRVKGEHGGIEIVIGVETNGSIRGVLIQSQREPSSVAEAMAGPWLENFKGRNADSSLRLGGDLPQVQESARASAQAVATGVRDQLTVLGFAERGPEAHERGQHSHP